MSITPVLASENPTFLSSSTAQSKIDNITNELNTEYGMSISVELTSNETISTQEISELKQQLTAIASEQELLKKKAAQMTWEPIQANTPSTRGYLDIIVPAKKSVRRFYDPVYFWFDARGTFYINRDTDPEPYPWIQKVTEVVIYGTGNTSYNPNISNTSISYSGDRTSATMRCHSKLHFESLNYSVDVKDYVLLVDWDIDELV